MDTSLYHRTDEFYTLFQSCQRLLAPLMQTSQTPLLLTCSGTGALEAALVNLTSVGDKVAIINGGKFGERWENLATQYQCKSAVLRVPWGQSPGVEQITDLIKGCADLRVFLMQANETSTGVAYPVRDIVAAVRQQAPNALIVVDAISGMCAHEIQMDAWGIDCLISASQKGFGLPPGLAFLALSKRAEAAMTDRPKFYFDLRKELKNQATGRTSWTPAITLLQSLHAVLGEMNQLGINAVVAHHQRLANATRSAVAAMGLELLAKTHPSNALTSIMIPNGVDGKKLVAHLRTHYGITAAGGQDQLSGKIIRLAHLGFVDTFDVLAGIAALECSLKDLGFRADVGVGARAFLSALY